MKQCWDWTVSLIIIVFVAAIFCWGNEGTVMAQELNASLNVMAYDRDVVIKINDIRLKSIKGGQSESVLLFLKDDPRIEELVPEMRERMKELFCLNEGENTIEISFKEKGHPSSPSLLTVTVEAADYSVPVIKYTENPDVKEGHAKGRFTIHNREPEGFNTLLIKREGAKVSPGVEYSFDFPDLSRDEISANYVRVPYNIHRNPLFNFSILMNKNWNGVRVAEPEDLPMDGTLIDIGKFNLYWPNHDPNGELKAQLIISLATVPANLSAADFVDAHIAAVFQDIAVTPVRSEIKETHLGPIKELLLSYTLDGNQFLRRICAFKAKDDTKIYLTGERHLLYLIQMDMEEKFYEAFCAEAFYMAKVSFNPDAD